MNSTHIKRILRNAGHPTIHTDCSDEVTGAISCLIDFINTHEESTSD